jgi:hypothetical protein
VNENYNDIIGNRNRDLPACSVVPQPTAPPAACPQWRYVFSEKTVHFYHNTMAERNGNMKIDNRCSESVEQRRYLGGGGGITNQNYING